MRVKSVLCKQDHRKGFEYIMIKGRSCYLKCFSCDVVCFLTEWNFIPDTKWYFISTHMCTAVAANIVLQAHKNNNYDVLVNINVDLMTLWIFCTVWFWWHILTSDIYLKNFWNPALCELQEPSYRGCSRLSVTRFYIKTKV